MRAVSGRDENRDRSARLAEALRENLRRRKAQARGRRAPEPKRPGEIEEPQGAGDGPGDKVDGG